MKMVWHTEIDVNEKSRVLFPAEQLNILYEHCRRKLQAEYLAGESRERKAFGLIAGYREGSDLVVARCIPLLKNARQAAPYKKIMDRVMAQHAVPSETPFARRGWVADPGELLARAETLQQQGLLLLGVYHMHRVPWENDPQRDRPTELDTILGNGSRMLMFIASLVDSDRPLIRSYYEGAPEREVPIVVTATPGTLH
jgi:hypothetical protein